MTVKDPINVDRLIAELIRDEGNILHVYKCPAGARTIGVGHNIDAKGLPREFREHLKKHGKITNEMSMLLLDTDICDAIAACRKHLPAEAWEGTTPARREVLINMTFNLGEAWINPDPKNKKYWDVTVPAFIRGDIEGVCEGMKNSKWFTQVGERAVRLIKKFREG